MQVVDAEHERSLAGEVDRQPVEAVEGGERGIAAAIRVHLLEDRQRGCGGAGEEALALTRLDQQRLEELPHEPERQLPLEIGAVRGDHPCAAACRPLPQRRDEAALADPRRPLDHHDPRVAATVRPKQPLERAELLLALERRNCAGAVPAGATDSDMPV